MKWVQLDGMGHQLEGRKVAKLILKLIDTCNEKKRGSKSVPKGSIKTIQSSSTDPNTPQGPHLEALLNLGFNPAKPGSYQVQPSWEGFPV